MTHPRIDERDREAIASRVQAGETLQAIADDYEFTREWIRQIALSAGVVPSTVRAERKDMALASDAEGIVEDREEWVPPRFSKRPYTQGEFEAFLANYRPLLLTRWRAAQELPISRSGHARPLAQRCALCHEWKAWDLFYKDSSRPFGFSALCAACSLAKVRERRDV